jgi:hypothetical protein
MNMQTELNGIMRVVEAATGLVEKAMTAGQLLKENSELKEREQAYLARIAELEAKLNLVDMAERMAGGIVEQTTGKRVSEADYRSAYPENEKSGAGTTGSRLLRNSCLDKAGEGELTFTLRAKDMLAPEIVREWAFRAQRAGTPIEKVKDARRIADEMEDWQIANHRHVPD